MKIIFLLALVALGSATTLHRGAQKEITVENDGIVVRVPGKKIVVIDKPKDDENGVQVFFKDQDRQMRKIKIDKDNCIVKEIFLSVVTKLPEKFFEVGQNKEESTSSSEEDTVRGGRPECTNIRGDKTQMDSLVTIFKKHEGVVNEDQFKELLNDIELAVDNKECNPVILEVLKELEVTEDEQTGFRTPFYRFVGMHWNIRNPMKGLWGSTHMNQNQEEDQQKRTNMYGTKQENELDQEQQVGRQINWVQQTLKDRQERQETLDDSNTSGFTRHTDCSEDAMSKQLDYQNNIREIQGQIFHQQLKVQQLQLQQQYLNQQKHQTKLQIMKGQQQGVPLTQMQELNKVRQGLQNKEQEILETQKNLHLTVHKLQQELTRQEERLQQCLEDERREDEKFMEKMY